MKASPLRMKDAFVALLDVAMNPTVVGGHVCPHLNDVHLRRPLLKFTPRKVNAFQMHLTRAAGGEELSDMSHVL